MKEANMSFEKQWSDAFAGAEMSPSEHVWTSIDGVLANQQAIVLQRRILIFKWLAAASVSLMLLAWSVLWLQNTDEMQLAENITIQKSKNTIQDSKNTIQKLRFKNQGLKSEIQDSKIKIQDSKIKIQDSKIKIQNSTVNTALNQNNTETSSTEIAKIEQKNILHEDVKTKFSNDDTSANNIALAIAEENENRDRESNFTIPLSHQKRDTEQRELKKESKTLVISHSFETLISALNPKEIDAKSLAIPQPLDKLYGVADPYAINDMEIEKDEFNLWAGVSMASGAFIPNSSFNENIESDAVSDPNDFSSISNLEQAYSNESLSTGSSILLGIDLRGKIAPKIILSSGIHYLRNNASLGSNLAVKSTDTGDSFALNNADATSESLQKDINSGKYELDYASSTFNNEFQYISIPLKAGYVVLNKKFNITLNSGLSTNFLLNVSQNIAGGQTSYSQNDSFKNEFNPVYVNFLSSIEFGYTFQKKYFLSIEPSYRQAITDFAKSNSLSEKPKDIGVSVGLKYNF